MNKNNIGQFIAELLNGQREERAVPKEEEKRIDNALVYAETSAKQRIRSFQNMSAIIFSAFLFLGMTVCVICDFAISGTFTWSLYPVSSILFAWLIVVPVIKWGSRGILWSLISLSVFTMPFLFVINIRIGNNLLMPIATRVSLLALAYLWCAYIIFQKLKEQKILAAAFSLLLTIPLCIAVNYCIAKLLSTAFLDIWDILSFLGIALCAIVLFIAAYQKRHSHG